MSVFASHTQKVIPVPGDPSHTVTIQRLNGRQIERAQAEHMQALMGGRSVRGWARGLKDILTNGVQATDRAVAEALNDPLNGYDRFSVVKSGVKAWTFVDEDGQPVTVTEKAIDDLDDETVEWCATEIMRLTKPALFQTPAQVEETRKND